MIDNRCYRNEKENTEMLPICNTLWIGQSLGPVERACLRSILRVGHRVVLYCYDNPGGVPHGVDIKDASTILPSNRIIKFRGENPALFANLFRYELQRLSLGLWIDTDQYLVRPIDLENQYIFGWEDKNFINNGVLRLPPNSPMLHELIGIFDEQVVPFWLGRYERWKAQLRLYRHGRTDLSRMPWGSAGPKALTALAKQYGLEDLALDSEIFYPVHYRDAGWILDPSKTLDDMLGPRSLGLHLWNAAIMPFKNEPAPAGSFLERLCQEGAED